MCEKVRSSSSFSCSCVRSSGVCLAWCWDGKKRRLDVEMVGRGMEKDEREGKEEEDVTVVVGLKR